MHVMITGGAGFLGSRLARRLLALPALTNARGDAQPVTRVTLLDVVAPLDVPVDARVRVLVGDLADARVIGEALSPDVASVFHLAAVVSAAAEADFDLGMRVNLDGTRRLFERCRTLEVSPKVVFASSVAVFGGDLPSPVPDHAPLLPQSSYGTQKAIGEFLVNDLSRKGFIDGRSLRLPTVTVRPGKPNRAASSFASAIIREPLAGLPAVCPVAPATRMWVQSPRTVIDNLIAGHEAAPTQFRHTRAVNVPGLSVSVADMVEALRTVAGDEAAARVQWDYDAAIDRIVSSWPADFTAERGRAIGMHGDADFVAIVRAYVEDQAAAR
jgi:nucleoside-diphosphate-sugar epimerase